MSPIIQTLSEEFLELLSSHEAKGLYRTELSKALGLNPPQLTNLIHILHEIVRKKDLHSDQYLHTESSLNELINNQFKDYPNLSERQIYELGTYVKTLRNYKREFNNVKLQLKKIPAEQIFFQIDVQDIIQIDLIAHTGDKIGKALLDFLRKDNKKQIYTRVLFRSPESETGRRQSGIWKTIRDILQMKLHGYPIDILFYENLPVHRSVICYPQGSQSRTAFLSTYYFPHHALSKSSEYAYLLTEKEGRHYAIETRAVLVQSLLG